MYTNLPSLLLLPFLLAPLITSTPLVFKPTPISPRQDAADAGVAAGAGSDTSNVGDTGNVAAGIAAAAASAAASAADANNAQAALASAAASAADANNAQAALASAAASTADSNNAAPAPGSGTATVNEATLSLIEQEEGFSANFYNDAEGQQTVGYGHDCVQIGCTNINPPLTQPQAEALLISDLAAYESCVCALPNASALSDNQYGALVSFTYNSGCGAVAADFGAQMQSSDFSGICAALPSTNLKGGIVAGRRAMEAGLCGAASGNLSGC